MRANVEVNGKVPVAIGENLCDVPCFKEGLVKKLRSKMPSEETVEDTRALFAAIADRARLKIL